jgi:hypothetical protein
MDEQVGKFNKQVRELLTMLKEELPKDAMIDTIQRKFTLAISLDRKLVLEEMTPELMQYKDFIADNRIDDLINMDWENELKEHRLVQQEEDKTSIREMTSLIKQLWDAYDAEQKTRTRKIIKRLLNHCIKYHKAKKDGLA